MKTFDELIIYIASFLLTLLFTMTIIKIILPKLKSKEFGQKILEEGPKWHKKKEGTPTMGGLSFILAINIVCIGAIIVFYKKIDTRNTLLLLNILIYSLLNGMIGIIDDIAKIKKSTNKGLTGKSKFLLQSIASIVFLFLVKSFVGINTIVNIPFFNYSIDLGFFYYLTAFVLLCGVVNSVNLSDGIDGLASSLVITVAVYFSFCTILMPDNKYLLIISSSLLGAGVGFFVFNRHPAKIFMGDTGSLYFGALIVSVSFMLDNILLVLLYGIIFIIEALSVIAQVLYFKVTKGKRLFLMAPLHHHFEKKGWSENKIVCIFSTLSFIACIITFASMLI